MTIAVMILSKLFYLLNAHCTAQLNRVLNYLILIHILTQRTVAVGFEIMPVNILVYPHAEQVLFRDQAGYQSYRLRNPI